MSGSDPKDVGPFTDSLITDRAMIWYKMVAIFQGSVAWTYLNSAKKGLQAHLQSLSWSNQH